MKFRLTDLNTETIKKGIAHMKETTIPEVLSKARSMVTGLDLAYDRFFREELEADEEELRLQRERTFAYAPFISVIVPVYMTPERSLRAMIESVLHQTYENWELCMVDGSQAKGTPPVLDAHRTEDGTPTVMEKVYSLETERIIRQYQEEYPQIHYVLMEENRGISGNINYALQMAHGEYVAFLDHDDVLTEDAIYQIVVKLQEQRYDIVYSDEDRMSENGNQYKEPRFKPDFDMELLRTCNYIGHFCMIRRSLLLEKGGFRSEYDGAQDYDMLLRCVGHGTKVGHIGRVLYHKRIHDGTSPERDSKHAQENQAGFAALEDYVGREHLLAGVTMSVRRNVYNIKYDTPGNPLVSIIITGSGTREQMTQMLEPFYEKTRYSNFEIILVDEAHSDDGLQKYYQQLQNQRRNVIVVPAQPGKTKAEYRNLGSLRAGGNYLLFLDAGIGIDAPTALGEMLGICMQEDVAVVSGCVYDEKEQLLYAGVRLAGKFETPVQGWQRKTEREIDLSDVQNLYQIPYRGMRRIYETDGRAEIRTDETGARRYYGLNREYQAVLGSCMLVKKKVFAQAGGFSDKFRSELSGLDFCLRIWERGYRIVNAAHAPWKLSAPSRDVDGEDTLPADEARAEQDLFEILWSHILPFC